MMSSAKIAPPGHQRRNVAQVSRRRVTSRATHEIARPAHSRYRANCGPPSELPLTMTVPVAQMQVAATTAATPSRSVRTGGGDCDMAPMFPAGVGSATMRENTGLGFAIAAIILVFACVLGGVVILLSWIGVTGYAVFKMVTGGADDDPNVAGIIIGIVLLVTTLVTLTAVGIRVIGKGMEPPKREDREREVVGV